MNIRGKEIKPETISMWLNIISFVIGILFYIRVERNLNKHVEPLEDTAKDTLVIVDTKLNYKIKELKQVEENIVRELRRYEKKLSEEQSMVIASRRQIYITIKSDWDSLSVQEQEAYVNNVIKILKHNKSSP